MNVNPFDTSGRERTPQDQTWCCCHQVWSAVMWRPRNLRLSRRPFLLPVYDEGSVLCLPGPPVIHNDLLGLAGVQGKVVGWTPLCQVLDFLSVEGLIIVWYETHYGGVVCKLHDQSCVNRVKRVELSTQPCSVPVFRISVDDVQSPTDA